MALNINELVLDRVRSLTLHDLTDGSMICRLTQLAEPSLNCTAEGEEVTDALGSRITTMYRAKAAEFTANNALFSLDLAAAQYGTKKEVADTGSAITDYTYDILTFTTGDATSGVALTHTPDDAESIRYAYELVNGGIGRTFNAGATPSATEFKVNAGKIIPPTGFTGQLFVEYTYEAESAVRVHNSATNFPETCSAIAYVIFRDICNENVVYSGKIVMPRAKLSPESIEIALTSTGQHPFTLTLNKDYCDEVNATLFDIIVAEE